MSFTNGTIDLEKFAWPLNNSFKIRLFNMLQRFNVTNVSQLNWLLQNQSSVYDDFREGQDYNRDFMSPFATVNSAFIDGNNVNQSVGTDTASVAATNEDGYTEDEFGLNIWIRTTFYVIYATICLLGIVGNGIVCYVVAIKVNMHTVTNVFIVNLALSDIFLCSFAPFTPLYLIAFKNWVFGRPLCQLVPFAQGVSVYISAFTLMSIAIDRYFVILHPFKPRMQMVTCIALVVAIWIFACLLTFPYAHFMELINVNGTLNYCLENWPQEEFSKTFGITTTVLQFVIPFVIITYCYVKICGKLWRRAKTIPGNVSARREEHERERTRRTNGMLISMVIIFVVSWLPLNILNLVSDFYSEAAHWRYQSAFFLIVHSIAMSSTCYNPFLYAWLNENFRKEFKEVLPCCFCQIKKSGHTSSTLVELQSHHHHPQQNDVHQTITTTTKSTNDSPSRFRYSKRLIRFYSRNKSNHTNSSIALKNQSKSNATNHQKQNGDQKTKILDNESGEGSCSGTRTEQNEFIQIPKTNGTDSDEQPVVTIKEIKPETVS